MPYRNPDEMKTIPHWRWAWWDVEHGVEFRQSVTGTHPKLSAVYIEDVYGKQVHIPDDGDLEMVFDGDDLPEFTVKMRCKKCEKIFLAWI